MQQGKCAQLYQKYRIQSQIGRGASGVCYCVQNIKTKQLMALKKIHISSIRKNSTKQAHAEVSILSKINHPHIIKLNQFFSDDNHLYIIMQYAPKGDLHNILKRRKIRAQFYTQDEIWNMSMQMITAIEYLHSHNIIHRDVKTLNIFMDSQEKLYLGDLGVSKIIKSDTGLYSRVGTPLYLAPEIIKYQKYDFKADIWGLGCVIYQLTSLHHPFEAKNIISLGQNIVNAQPKYIEKYSLELNNFILDMLQKHPSKRPNASQLIKRYFKQRMDIKIEIDGGIKSDNIQIKSQRIIQKETLNKIYDNKMFFESKPNRFRQKVTNNYFDKRCSLNVKSQIIQDNINKQASIKGVIFKDISPRDKRLEDTVIFHKKIQPSQSNGKNVEATTKSFTINKIQAKQKKQTFKSEAACIDPDEKILAPVVTTNFHFSSQKKLDPIVSNIPLSKSSMKNCFFPEEDFSVQKYYNKKQPSTVIDINRLTSDSLIQGPIKIIRTRPKSGIMTKQRHQSTMKNIKKSFRKADFGEIDKSIQTRFLKKPQVIIF